MEKKPEKILSVFQRLSSAESFLLMIGVILLADSYLIIEYKKSLFSINWAWAKENISVGNFLTFLLLFSSLYGLIIPWITSLIDNIIPTAKYELTSLEPSSQLTLSSLLSLSIVENNSTAYQYYLAKKDEIEKFKHLRVLCFSFILILLFSTFIQYFQSEKNTTFLLKFYTLFISDGFFSSIFKIFIFGLSIWVVAISITRSDSNFSFVYLPKFENRKQMHWINEFNSGLIDKKAFTKYLRTANEEAFANHQHDFQSEAQLYCIHFNLAIVRNSKFELTPKGKFFLKYCRYSGNDFD